MAKPLLADTQQVLQLIDYVDVDYNDAIINGQIANQAEYDEMLDFTAGITQQLADLPELSIKAELLEHAQRLTQMVQQKVAAEKIKTLTASIKK